MRGYHAEEISTLNDEELNNLINALRQEKIDRDQKKKEELIDTFRKAWVAIKEAGYDINLSLGLGDSETINFEDIEIY